MELNQTEKPGLSLCSRNRKRSALTRKRRNWRHCFRSKANSVGRLVAHCFS